MDRARLVSTARQMIAEGRGILAADESTPTAGKRLAAVGLESTEETRRRYRQLLFTADGLEQGLAGIILFDETFRQQADDGRPFPELIAGRGILPGIKVDRGLATMPFSPDEKITQGLDGLAERLADYAAGGARFSKWRAVFADEPGLPSEACVIGNSDALARFAAFSQAAGLVPIVETEVLYKGDHSLADCADASERVLAELFHYLRIHGVLLEGLVLKANMVLAGKNHPQQADAEQVADITLRTLERTVPAAIPGIAFLSGGQTPEQAVRHLDAINRRGPAPWQLSFSFARALQEPCLAQWAQDQDHATQAQRQLRHRLACTLAARAGRYQVSMEEDDTLLVGAS